MTKEEAIKYAKNKIAKLKSKIDGPRSMYGDYAAYSYELEFVSAALHALIEQADIQTNQPLTMEELRDMDGEPVWIEEGISTGSWALVARSDFGGIRPLSLFKNYQEKDYGVTWLAYRRKPEEETHEKSDAVRLRGLRDAVQGQGRV